VINNCKLRNIFNYSFFERILLPAIILPTYYSLILFQGEIRLQINQGTTVSLAESVHDQREKSKNCTRRQTAEDADKSQPNLEEETPATDSNYPYEQLLNLVRETKKS